MSRVNLKTGDILLFDYKAGGLFGIFTKLIKYFTKSDYSHVAMVIKDPAFIHPSLKGTYIWESSWEDIIYIYLKCFIGTTAKFSSLWLTAWFQS